MTDGERYAHRLYGRVPAHYRTYDKERGEPLLALLRVVGEQAAGLRADVDALWDNFFIETCADWAVPYLGAVVGANLLGRPVGKGHRLEVRSTVGWRRRRGTPGMLGDVAAAVTGWPAALAEFFRSLGWAQNVNHVRPEAVLTADVRDPLRLSRLGHADDPWAHAADVRAPGPCDQPRVTAGGVGRPAWGTPGRHQIKTLGVFVRRLHAYTVRGATPAAAEPGRPAPPAPAFYTFDPLFTSAPLFAELTRAPVTRAEFAAAPWKTFGTDIVVRQYGIPVAAAAAPRRAPAAAHPPVRFGHRLDPLALHSTGGLRVMDSRSLAVGGRHFVIRVSRHGRVLGHLSTLFAAADRPDAYGRGDAAPAGDLTVTVELGGPSAPFPELPVSPPGRFPGAVLAVRAALADGVRLADGLFVYLPAVTVKPGPPVTFLIDPDDGSTSRVVDGVRRPARASEGQVYPPREVTDGRRPADGFDRLHPHTGLVLPDPGRLAGVDVRIQAEVFTKSTAGGGGDHCDPRRRATAAGFRVLAAVDRSGPRVFADPSDTPGLLAVRVVAERGTFVPPTEVVVRSATGKSLLVYLQAIEAPRPAGDVFLVADDGSTYHAPTAAADLSALADHGLPFAALLLARPSASQVLPLAGAWPLQHRRPVAIDLCRGERRALLRPDELGIDPELGRFAFPPGDDPPAHLSVDYVEAFSADVGARTFERGPAAAPTATVRKVHAGSAVDAEKVYPNLAAALAAVSESDEVVEICDSATYAHAGELAFDRPGVKSLVIRAAAGQRPCLTFDSGPDTPAAASLRFDTPPEQLRLGGLLIRGGPVTVGRAGPGNAAAVVRLAVDACTLDPRAATADTGWASVVVPGGGVDVCVSRSVTGGLHTGGGRLVVADSVVDSPDPDPSGPRTRRAIRGRTVCLDRVTVLGETECEALTASETILDGKATVADQQAGCLRFTRYEVGSVLPRRYLCVPTEEQARTHPTSSRRCLAPVFNARRFGRPDYAQLAVGCPSAILRGGEEGAEVGAFARALAGLRLDNLLAKLQEFMPVGLTAAVVAET